MVREAGGVFRVPYSVFRLEPARAVEAQHVTRITEYEIRNTEYALNFPRSMVMDGKARLFPSRDPRAVNQLGESG